MKMGNKCPLCGSHLVEIDSNYTHMRCTNPVCKYKSHGTRKKKDD